MNKSKLRIIIPITVMAVVLTIGGFMFSQYKNHQTNLLVIEKCFENFEQKGKVVIVKENFWSPVTCEK